VGRILITRASQQASALAEALRVRGLETVVIPAIELAAPRSWCALDAALACLRSYDWLVFTSANAVEAFAERARAMGVMLTLPKVAAIGPATARAVATALGVGVELMPVQAVAESFVEVLKPYALRADGSATRFLLVRAEVARDVLPEALVEAGAEVTIAAAYRTVIPAGSVAAVRELFRSRESWPDAITFTSSSTVTNLLTLTEAAGVVLPEAVPRISIGPITSQTLREAGIPAHTEAKEASVVGLAEAVVGWVQQAQG
jgi:uroporphyrinogen-III synthase